MGSPETSGWGTTENRKAVGVAAAVVRESLGLLAASPPSPSAPAASVGLISCHTCMLHLLSADSTIVSSHSTRMVCVCVVLCVVCVCVCVSCVCRVSCCVRVPVNLPLALVELGYCRVSK